jgi:hypothetical protein
VATRGRFAHRGVISGVALSMLLSGPLAAQQGQTKAGVLTCKTSASLGLIVGSHQKLSCRFTPDGSGVPETYVGAINRLGLDLGIRAGGAMAWAVIAPTNGVPHGALAGKYVGASGGASLGVGVAANALIGGSHRSFALQPLSVEGQVGVNLALGVAGLTLVSGR